VEYSAKDQTTRCPYCGTATEIPKPEEELPGGPSAVIPLAVELTELTQAVYEHLASGDMTPDELLEYATFTKKERFYAPVYAYAGSFEAQWTASFGYDRREEYTVYEKRTENGHTHSVPVTKTKTVTDWRPVSGTDTGRFAVLAYAGEQLLTVGLNAVSLAEHRDIEALVPFNSSYTTGIEIEPYTASETDAYHGRAESQVSEIIEHSVRQHAQGDRQRDWHWTANTDKGATTVLVPICHAIYEYQGKPYHVWASGSDLSRFVADELPVDDKRKQSVSLGFLPILMAVIASAYAVFGLNYGWAIPTGVVAASILFGFLRKNAIIGYSRNVRQFLLANQKAAASNTAGMTTEKQSEVARGMVRPRRPWLSLTAHDYIVIPLVVLLMALIPFSQYLTSSDGSPRTQYTTQRSQPTSSASPAAAPLAATEQTSPAPQASDAGQVPESPSANAPQSPDSTNPEATNSEPSVQRNPSAARKLNTDGLRALAGPQPNLIEAKRLFQKAVQSDPENVEMLNNLGDAYGRLEDFKTAEAIFAKVLILAPKRRVANGNMGYVEAKQGNIEGAAQHFCEYVHGFDSFDKGEARLQASFGDPDPQVQNAVRLTIANCRP
jgi:tetratricopeptide (TPR) repeat protein